MPEKLDFEADDLPLRWKRWKEEITLYMDLTMAGKPEDVKVKLFLYLIGTGAVKSIKPYLLPLHPAFEPLLKLLKPLIRDAIQRKARQ